MKKLHLFLIVLITSFLLLLSFNLGTLYGQGETLNAQKLQSDIALRYLKYIGNPETDIEHCIFTRVIYGDTGCY